MSVETLERLGRPYFKCSECEYSAMDEAYVTAHAERAHLPEPPPGAEGMTAIPGTNAVEAAEEPAEITKPAKRSHTRSSK